ncbi:hypothetical protein Q7P35_003616 [Cladosporium inversicolor]
MNNFRTSTYDALGHHAGSEGTELTSFTSIDSRTTNDGRVNTSDQYEISTYSTAALSWPQDPEDFGLAVRAPLQSSDGTRPYSSSQTKSKRRSALQRIGLQTVAILLFTLVLMAAVIEFLTFLWTAAHDNVF